MYYIVELWNYDRYDDGRCDQLYSGRSFDDAMAWMKSEGSGNLERNQEVIFRALVS